MHVALALKKNFLKIIVFISWGYVIIIKTIFQMLNKPPEPSDMMGQAHQPNTAASMHVPQDLVYKLLHVQEVCSLLIILFI